MHLAPFQHGAHYTELRGGSYRFELLRDMRLTVPAMLGRLEIISFVDYRMREWARFEGADLIMRAGYAWNGASPKWWIPIFGWVGTPDPVPTRLATLVHDVCFQFIRTFHWPEQMDIPTCNALFHAIMTAHGFRWANTYHGAVRDFGERFAGKYPKRGEYSILINP